jgi:hypothetical protein
MSGENSIYVQSRLTRSSPFDLLCRDGKEANHLDDNIQYNTLHSVSRWDTRISFQSLEKVFDPAEELDEHVLMSPNVFYRLEDLGVTMWPLQAIQRENTPRGGPRRLQR